MKTIKLLLALIAISCSNQDSLLKKNIRNNKDFKYVVKRAKEVTKTGFNAGDGYGEVWIRDYNTFIELSCELYPHSEVKENLLVFFRIQGDDGNIIDGFIPSAKAIDTPGGYKYYRSELEPRYAGHKNTVETDQETSLIQTVYKYVTKTGDKEFLNVKVGDKSVAQRMDDAVEFLLNHRFNEKYGLLWGATTVDWGDVQPEHDWGVYLTDDTHYCLDVYDNAMFIIALNNLIELKPQNSKKYIDLKEKIYNNTRKYLWDTENQKFIPHIYLNGSPFDDSFDENLIYYHGGTAVAIEAGLLSKNEIKVSLQKMIENVKESGAPSIGLTNYPTYPAGSFKNKGMYPYGYQNGGDWTWFGGRMIQQLIKYGFVQEAYDQVQPMIKRVVKNKGFYEWYSKDNKPKGSGTFRGSAGVLHKSIEMFNNYSNNL